VIELRTKLRATRTQRSKAENLRLSEVICSKIDVLPEMQNISKIAAYWPVKGEVDIRPALSQLIKRGIQVFIPRIEGQNLAFVELTSLDDTALCAGPFDIPYPLGDAHPLSSMDCILVPGLGFDRACNRLGRGGGFYDRALSAKVSCPIRIGVGFSDQIVEEGLDPRSHDVPMHIVVTDNETYRAEHDQN